MPEPVKRGQRYMPGLDGLRAIAVLGVIAYHLNFGWAPGGLLGVGVFFTLSGYLITDILLTQVAAGRIHFAKFWLARARRLLPALFVMLIVVMAWVTVIGPHQPSNFRLDLLSAVGYVNNWWLIFHNVSYFAQFASPSPLNHLWSLSVEEQFYIFWPFLLLIGTYLVHERPNAGGLRPRLGAAMIGISIASAILMAVLYTPSIDPSRVYYGTDTRAQELLFGAALAAVWPSRMLRPGISKSARRMIDRMGVIGLAGILLMFWQCGQYDTFLYRGGFVVLSIAVVLLLVALAHPASRLGPVVGMRPLRWVGERSYGIYLWHYPIIVLTTPASDHTVNLPRAIAQVAATFVVAALSWKYIENPIRRGGLRGLRERIRASVRRAGHVPRRAWAIAAACIILTLSALAGMAGAGVGPNPGPAGGDTVVANTEKVKPDKVSSSRTQCRSLVYIGDSTSLGVISPDYLPNPKQRISGQFGNIGATTQHFEISGGRSIYETLEGMPNAQTVAQSWVDRGFKGCWVLALGTNEAADVAAGSNVGYDQRIADMMRIAKGEPVLWVNVKTLLNSGSPYDDKNMAAWDQALANACKTYPNMRVYDWRDNVKDPWYVADGIHFTSQGYRQRSKLIADALLDGFPAGGKVNLPHGESCVVHPTKKQLEARSA
jgi:peptidoglycan/LPS O-acetylase OafA/YrhL